MGQNGICANPYVYCFWSYKPTPVYNFINSIMCISIINNRNYKNNKKQTQKKKKGYTRMFLGDKLNPFDTSNVNCATKIAQVSITQCGRIKTEAIRVPTFFVSNSSKVSGQEHNWFCPWFSWQALLFSSNEKSTTFFLFFFSWVIFVDWESRERSEGEAVILQNLLQWWGLDGTSMHGVLWMWCGMVDHLHPTNCIRRVNSKRCFQLLKSLTEKF